MSLVTYTVAAILTILAVKVIYALVKLLMLPKRDGENSWTFYILLSLLWAKLPQILIVAAITGIGAVLFGAGISVVLLVAAVFGFVDSFLEF